ncbi:hypothetical protein B0H17DRAFT_1145361 [Mycena rosella]|uniref:Uncharacterized protein n=1 Tax=Mycena rosella TaxID=1033263 RepID=A0AAD7CRH7_MYCRO|nr:hypothetical protein B0H17DRAFT_1145361 [Mycena rosella]
MLRGRMNLKEIFAWGGSMAFVKVVGHIIQGTLDEIKTDTPIFLVAAVLDRYISVSWRASGAGQEGRHRMKILDEISSGNCAAQKRERENHLTRRFSKLDVDDKNALKSSCSSPRSTRAKMRQDPARMFDRFGHLVSAFARVKEYDEEDCRGEKKRLSLSMLSSDQNDLRLFAVACSNN